MAFDLTILGASGTYPAPGSACSGYLLTTDTTAVWVDTGSGTLANLQRHVALQQLDGVVCTHEHPDHWIDLTIAVNALRYGVDRPADRIPLLWTEGTAALYQAVAGRPIEPTFAPVVLVDGAIHTVGDIDLSFSVTDHPVETYAVRADHAGRSLVYSADTGDGWDMRSLGPDVDLAMVEATLPDDYDGDFQHLRAGQAAEMAAAAGASRLLLTHLDPAADRAGRLAAAASVFPGPVALAEEGAVHRI